MDKFQKGVLFFALVTIAYRVPHLKGLWKLHQAPPLNAVSFNESPLNFSAQQSIIIETEYRICLAFQMCSSNTTLSETSAGAQQCSRAATLLESIKIPNQLPLNVQLNLELYKQSLTHTSRKFTSMLMDGTNLVTSIKSHLSNWEIDTCGVDSIPQKIFRLYQLDQMSNTKTVTCREIESLYNSRKPASLKK